MSKLEVTDRFDVEAMRLRCRYWLDRMARCNKRTAWLRVRLLQYVSKFLEDVSEEEYAEAHREYVDEFFQSYRFGSLVDIATPYDLLPKPSLEVLMPSIQPRPPIRISETATAVEDDRSLSGWHTVDDFAVEPNRVRRRLNFNSGDTGLVTSMQVSPPVPLGSPRPSSPASDTSDSFYPVM